MSKQCDLSWCNNEARGQWCNGHWSNVRKHGVPNPPTLAKRVGTRTLLAKTCKTCGVLKLTGAFQRRKKNGRSYVGPNCTSCVVEYNKSHPTKDPEYHKKYQREYKRSHPASPEQRAYHVKYVKEVNDKSRETAHHHQQPYTGADWVVLLDPNLSIGEKAKKLGRTYKAVSNQLYNHKKAVEAQINNKEKS